MHRIHAAYPIAGLVAASAIAAPSMEGTREGQAGAAPQDDAAAQDDAGAQDSARLVGRPWWAEPVFPLEVRRPRVKEWNVAGDWRREDAPDLPEPVLAWMLRGREALRADLAKFRSAVPPIHSKLVRMMGPRSTWLWCHSYEFPGSPPTWELLLKDLQTGEYSAMPLVIKPSHYFRFAPYLVDLDADGIEELATRCYFHNGTVLNHYPRSWWRIGEDLSFHRVFAMSALDESILADHVWGSARRRLVRSATGELQVEVWRDPPHRDDPPYRLGRLLLQHDPAADAWKVADRHVLAPDRPWASQVNLSGYHDPMWVTHRPGYTERKRLEAEARDAADKRGTGDDRQAGD